MGKSLPERFGPYVLLHRLGSGGQGDVHLARPVKPLTGLPSVFVIKRLHAERNRESSFVRRFRHEAAIAVALDTPHVAKVYDVGRVGDQLYLVMEYIPGWALSRVLKFYARSKQSPPVDASIRVVAGALRGLSALHEAKDEQGRALGIVHRDLAPKNLMLGEDGLTRLIDLGLGRSEKQDWKTATGIIMGTPGYMSPEQVVAETVDHRSDLYVMGIVLFEILTMQRFIETGSVGKMLRASVSPKLIPPTRLRPEIPSDLDGVVLKALAPDPPDRFQSAGEFLTALSRATPVGMERIDAKTVVGQILWEEQTNAGTQVRQLISMTLPAVEPQELGPEPEQFATRAGVSPFADTLAGDAPALPKVVEEAPTPIVRAADRTKKKKKRFKLTSTAALIVLLPLTFGLGIAFEALRRKSAPSTAAAPVRRAPLSEVPPKLGVVPGAPKRAEPEAEAEQPTAKRVEPPPPAKTRPPAAQKARTKKAPPAAPAPKEPPALKADVSETPPAEDEVVSVSAINTKKKKLLDRASKLRSETTDPERKAALGKIVFKLAQGGGWSASKLREIESKLNELSN